MENKHTMSDLYQMQSMSLNDKIRMTKYRIKEWVNTYGEDGVYLSFSGGKDSTVLGHIIREKKRLKRKPVKKNKLAEICEIAKSKGMSYGQYMAEQYKKEVTIR